MSHQVRISRRQLLQGAGALSLTGLLGSTPSWAQARGPIVIGTLTPQTGAGSIYGPGMRDAMAAVAKEVNAAGGVLGRQVQLVSEDDQTNPEATVRAARKLIDVDKAVAVLGPWASSVAAAVAPVCWESQTFCAIVGSADSITKLPHQGFLIRTQPNISAQAARFGKLAIDQGARSIYFMGPQTPFTQIYIDVVAGMAKAKNISFASEIYDGAKTSYRTEVEKALRAKPDVILLGGFVNDNAIVLREIFRAGYKGKLIGFGTGVNTKLLESVPPEAVEGVFAVTPSPALDSKAYQRFAKLIGNANPGPFESQAYDMINVTLLAIAQAKQATGPAIRDAVRQVSQGGGTVVDNAVDGIKLIGEGKKVNYDGASGSLEFDAVGDIVDAKFKIEQVKGGKLTTLEIS